MHCTWFTTPETVWCLLFFQQLFSGNEARNLCDPSKFSHCSFLPWCAQLPCSMTALGRLSFYVRLNPFHVNWWQVWSLTSPVGLERLPSEESLLADNIKLQGRMVWLRIKQFSLPRTFLQLRVSDTNLGLYLFALSLNYLVRSFIQKYFRAWWEASLILLIISFPLSNGKAGPVGGKGLSVKMDYSQIMLYSDRFF